MFKAIIACSNTFASLHYTCRNIMLPCKCVHRCIDDRMRYVQNIHSTSTNEICFNNNNNVCKTQKTLLSVQAGILCRILYRPCLRAQYTLVLEISDYYLYTVFMRANRSFKSAYITQFKTIICQYIFTIYNKIENTLFAIMQIY